MGRRSLVSLAALAAVVAIALLAQAPVAGQTAGKTWTPPRTADGKPDLQGIWTDNTLTPFERPKSLGSKEFYTEQELADLTKRVHEADQGERIEGAELGAANPQAVRYDLELYGFDRNKLRYTSTRTSLIVGPEGVVPPMLPQARARNAERAAKIKGHEFDSYEQRSLSEQCLYMGQEAIPMTPAANEGNLLQIVQGPGYVTLLHEIDHNTRVIPTDGRPHLPSNIRQWKGDSVGHWEGNTLVVETTNFIVPGTNFNGGTAALRLIERFTLVGPNTLRYEYTLNDPATWTKPWTAETVFPKIEPPLYEFACHEQNYGLMNVVKGAQAREVEEAAKKSSPK
jgi:hypothetical protein